MANASLAHFLEMHNITPFPQWSPCERYSFPLGEWGKYMDDTSDYEAVKVQRGLQCSTSHAMGKLHDVLASEKAACDIWHIVTNEE